MTETSQLSELLLRWEELRRQGRSVTAEELCLDCPELAPALRGRIEGIGPMAWLNGAGVSSGGPVEGGRADEPAGSTLRLCLGAEPVPGYRLVERQGRGTFGEVWAAQALGRLVAVKFIHGHLEAPEPRRLAEAELEGLVRIRRVSHPNVLQIVGTQVSGATLVLVTELADCTLEQHFRSLPHPGTGLDRCIDAASLLRGAAEALDHLRRGHGLMHLDVKPANLLLVSGVCKLADFGTVKGMRAGGVAPGGVLLAGGPGPGGDLHRTTARYGRPQDVPWREAMHPKATLYTDAWAFTPRYASPEMFRGRASHHSDQYSLALTFCELAAGATPFGGDPEAQISRREEGRADLSLLPESLHPAVARALSPRPEDRFPYCVDFIRALEERLPARRVRRATAPRRATDSTPDVTAIPEARPKKDRMAKAALALLLVPFAPLLAGYAALRWGGWLARQFFPSGAHPRRAQRAEYLIVFLLVLAVAWLPAYIYYCWCQRLASIPPAMSKGAKE